MNIFIIAGEVSGDFYASNLANELKKASKKNTIFGIGGFHLKQQADHFVYESVYSHGVSLKAQFFSSTFKKSLLSSITSLLSTHTIDRVIIIDFQHFNHTIAKCIKPFNTTIDTFITPNFWMWKSKKKAKEICNYSRNIFAIFKPEYDFYKAMHSNTYYFGHPLTTHIISPPTHKITFAQSPVITLLPGSRPQEFKLYLNIMLETVSQLSKSFPRLSIHLPISAPEYKKTIERYLSKFPDLAHILTHKTSHDAIKKSTLVISASGSATLETILLKRPLIVLAALPPLTYFVAKYILRLKLPYISLPNFLCNTSVVPELIQSNITVNNIINEATPILKSPLKLLKNYETIIKCLRYKKNVYNSIIEKVLK